jgi:hypothetical protein
MPSHDVHLSIEGDPFPLLAAVDLIAYRILQEAPVEPASGPFEVSLHFSSTSMGVEVQAADRRAWPTPTIRERVEMCSGRLDVTTGEYVASASPAPRPS